MSNDRWLTCIHEASHGVVAITLGGECSQLCIQHKGGGLAFIHALSNFDRAVAIAAPTAASKILADALPPAHEPSTELLDIRHSITELTNREKLEYVAARFPDSDGPSDAETIAQFCIAGIEAEPQRWVERFNLVHHIAGRVVTDQSDNILSVARALFAKSILTTSEIQEAMK